MREELALSVTVDGQAHFGLYAVESEMMTAWIPSVGSRTCWLEGREPSKVAKLLLQEVIRECRRKHTVAVSRPSRRSSDSADDGRSLFCPIESFAEPTLR